MSLWRRVRSEALVAHDLKGLAKRINDCAEDAESRGEHIEVVTFQPVEAKHRIPDTNIYPVIYSAIIFTGFESKR